MIAEIIVNYSNLFLYKLAGYYRLVHEAAQSDW